MGFFSATKRKLRWSQDASSLISVIRGNSSLLSDISLGWRSFRRNHLAILISSYFFFSVSSVDLW